MKRKDISEIWGIPVRRYQNQVYVFDKQGLCQILSVDDYKKEYADRIKEFDIDSNLEWGYYTINDWKLFSEMERRQSQAIREAGRYLKEGDTLDEYFGYIEECSKKIQERRRLTNKWGHYYPRPEGLDRFITKIERPNFIRFPENDRKNTFDIIKIIVNTCTEWDGGVDEYFRENIDAIYGVVLDKLKNSKSFQKYGVPSGCLALTGIHIIGVSSYEFVFELKKELRNISEED